MVEVAELPPGTIRFPADRLRRFATAVFDACDLPADDAALCADVLVAADLRGIRSHGVARLPYFAVRFANGVINPHPALAFERRSSTTGRLDADNGMVFVEPIDSFSNDVAGRVSPGGGRRTPAIRNPA